MFTEDELSDLEYVINERISDLSSVMDNTALWETNAKQKIKNAEEEQGRFKQLLEKVRKM